MLEARRHVLLTAPSFSAAAKDLFDLAKAKRASVSLASVCERIGLKSRGHFSEVLAGRRSLPAAKVPALGRTLGLVGPEVECLTLLHARQDPKGDADAAEATETRLALVRRVLRETQRPAPGNLGDMALAFKTFAAFSMYGDRPTRNELVDFFGRAQCLEVDRALAWLAGAGLISLEGDRWQAHYDRVIFKKGDSSMSLRDYVSTSLADAQGSLDRWFDEKDLAAYQSSIISVRHEDYKRLLPELKARLREEQARLDSDQSDMLVHFNVQVYPVEAGKARPDRG